MNFTKKGIKDKYKNMHSLPNKMSRKTLLTVLKVFLVIMLFVIVTVGFAGLGFVKGIIDNAPDINQIDLSPTGYATKIYDSNGNEIESLVQSGSNRVYASLNEMPTHLIYAFVDIEDERFFEHNGIDIMGIVRAGIHGITSGSFNQGASTITQQLIKNKLFNVGMGENTFMHSLKRKIQEQYLAINLEKIYDKTELLEAYLNMINLGSGTLGVQAAAHKYFNKDVWELTLSESTVIAGITKNPSGFDPILYPNANAERRKLILNNMLKFEHITKEEYDEALNDDVYARIQNVRLEFGNGNVYSYFVDELIGQLISDLQAIGYTKTEAQYLVYSGGLEVYTTMDSRIQQICDEEYQNPDNFPANTEYSISWALTVEHADGTKSNYSERNIEAYFKYGDSANGVKANSFFKLIFDSPEEADEHVAIYKKSKLKEGDKILGERIYYTPQPQSSFVVIEQSTGHIVALVGGRGEKEASLTLNRATDTLRQPGSTFKVLSTYAAGINEKLFTLADVKYDEEGYVLADGTPVKNWDKKYQGFVSIRKSIEDSINIVALKSITEITPALGFEYVQKFGISTLIENEYLNGLWRSDIGQSLALGGLTKGVSNLELTAAYAAIANKGTYIEPIYYTKVLDHSGNVILDKTTTQESHEVLTTEAAALLTNAMQDVVKKGTGTAAKLSNMPVAGKTGTTDSYNDIWFAGYTPYYTATIWSGYDENKNQTKSATGNSNANSYHKKFWNTLMTRIHEGLEYKEFQMPKSLVQATVCSKSGKLAIPGTCDTTQEGNCITTEYFTMDTVPTEYCDNHIIVEMCGESGKIACDACPRETIWGMVWINNVNLTPESGASNQTPFVLPFDDIQMCPLHYVPPVPDIPIDPNNPDAVIPGETTTDITTEPTGDTTDVTTDTTGETTTDNSTSTAGPTTPVTPDITDDEFDYPYEEDDETNEG